MIDPLEHEWDKLSVDFPLTKDSVVLEIGGYEGRWAQEIAKRYDPRLYVFEPQTWAYNKCVEKLYPYKNTRIYNMGLAVERGEFPMGNYETDGCSLTDIPSSKPVGLGYFIAFEEFFKNAAPPVRHIDVCLMNIEGYEFKLIPHMIETGVMDNIDYFMCQFHPRNDAEFQQHYDIRRQLSKTKKKRFDFGKILTCWEPR